MDQVYLKHLTKVVVSTVAENVDDDPVPDNHRLEVSHVSVENQTTGYTRLVIGIVRGGVFYEMEEEDAPAVDDIYWTRSLILVPEGWAVRCRLTGCTADDVVQVYIQGKISEVR